MTNTTARPNEVPTGFYVLRNKLTRTCLDLYGGEKQNGGNIMGWRCSESFLPHSLWYLERQSSGDYYIRNARAGTSMDICGPYKEDGTKVHSWQFYPQLNTQRWDLIDKGGYYCIKNVGMQTYLHLQNGSSENNVEAQISSFTEGNDNQLWFLDRLSRSADEIRSILRGNPIMSEVSDQTITYYDNVQYLVLPNRLRESAYSISGLEKRMRREGLFDFEDFNIKLRDAITTWGNDHIALDGCRILFGIVHGSCEGQLYPYSWTLTEDCRSVVFFDAYLGKELTAASLGELGFKARFAVF